jgi:hypothetical protein
MTSSRHLSDDHLRPSASQDECRERNLNPVEEDHEVNPSIASLTPAWSGSSLLRQASIAVYLLWASPAWAQEQEATAPKPATVQEAAKVLDLSTFPLLEGAKAPGHRRMAELYYEGKADVKKAYEFQQKALAARGWQELPGTHVDADSAFATFAKDGFTASVMVFPGDAKKGTVKVSIGQRGNVDTAKLPIPPGTKLIYAGPASAMYVAESARDATAKACRDLLVAQGWQPYGTAGDSLIFKQNAIRLNAMISTAPAQGGKTSIQYSTGLLSADVPAPSDAVRVQYSDSTKALSFDAKSTPKVLVDFYREVLGKAGWKPTTDNTIKNRAEEMLIFRNPQRDMLTLKFNPFENVLRGTLEHLSAAESDELDRRADAEIARRKEAERAMARKAKVKPTVTIALPVDARDVKAKNGNLEFTVPAGRAKPVVEDLRNSLRQSGWKEEVAALEQVAGALSVSKEGNGSLTVNYTDTGIEPAEISITAIGVSAEPANAGGKPKAEREQ